MCLKHCYKCKTEKKTILVTHEYKTHLYKVNSPPLNLRKSKSVSRFSLSMSTQK